jgi:SAM-dependent methyltransferase
MESASLDRSMDWVESWKQIVHDRATLAGTHADPGYWDRRSASFARSTRMRVDEFLMVLDPYTSSSKTLIDVGAGAGRHAAPLAERLEWVTAVEPSEGMRSRIPVKGNMTVVASTWEDAEVAQADLVICCHVLYGVADAPAFIAKLEAAATERVFIELRYGQLQTASDPIWELMTGIPRAPQPQFADLWNLLLQMGIEADVAALEYEGFESWNDVKGFEAEYRPPLAECWDEAKAEAWLAESTTREADGRLTFGRGRRSAGVAHWRPRR